ncbi:alpha/beta hydrolase [Hymenobacter sp. H14-R3]|uniref:alpha/beta fold hydrolase n=1 Tax=Hymenobacter sp. H14-R3 TaxID=3046308 RepID=UPI0024B8B1B6|nr:alpha/beta hydrolase [Hymenobacter sp. H14-R3]MDJ0365850.1 alpha/beta hydrolase [Hymenobacter sp. H14-R3]
MKRILLLHGYTEAGFIFDTLRPLLPPAAEVLVPELEADLAQWPPGTPLTAVTLARYLAARYRIGPHDVLIGHSMGGWLAAYIKEQTGATAILLSGFTDQAKIVAAVRRPWVLALAARSGLLQSRLASWHSLRRYRFDESRGLHTQLVGRTPQLGRRYLWQQLQLLFAPVPPLTTAPELRLHARRDHIIRPPDEPYGELPGDHFAHYFYPRLVVEAIRPFL